MSNMLSSYIPTLRVANEVKALEVWWNSRPASRMPVVLLDGDSFGWAISLRQSTFQFVALLVVVLWSLGLLLSRWAIHRIFRSLWIVYILWQGLRLWQGCRFWRLCPRGVVVGFH